MEHKDSQNPTPARGFSLIELVIVVVIIGIIGAVAVPRMSRGAKGAAVSALIHDISILNKAVELYAIEHGGDYPRIADITEQLTGTTNRLGDSPTGVVGEVIYGPYLRAVPPLPIGEKKGNSGIALIDGDGVGWIYAPARGLIRPNLTKNDGAIDEPLVDVVVNSSNLDRDDLVGP